MVLPHPPSVTVLAVDGDELLVVVQSRPGAGGPTVELPAGWVENGETPLEAARRELREECSVAAEHWRALGSFWAAPGYSTERVTAFEARGLSYAPGEPDPDEEIEVKRLPLAELPGGLSDANSIAAVALWAKFTNTIR